MTATYPGLPDSGSAKSSGGSDISEQPEAALTRPRPDPALISRPWLGLRMRCAVGYGDPDRGPMARAWG